jgi:3',5'-cyclic AMP phosphodiesterase CpdA
MKLLLFSDVHLPTPLRGVPLRDWAGKRLIGGANWLIRRRRAFASAVVKVDALAELARREGVSAVVFTGDYTVLGTEAELAAAREVFAPFFAWSYVGLPGNHDLYLADTVRHRRFERHLGDTLRTDLPELATDGPWPLVRLLDDTAAIVAFESARPNPQPWRSSGRVPPRQLAALSLIAADPRIAHRFLFLATHYAPRLGNGQPDTRQHGLDNADALLATIAPFERAVLLHGHVHHCYHLAVPGVGPSLFSAGSATYAGREGCWLFELEGARLSARRGRYRSGAWQLDEPFRVPDAPPSPASD